jgi:hypothetical protein
MTTRPIGADGRYYKKAHLRFLEGTHDQNPVSKIALQASIDALGDAVEMTNNNYARAMSELAYMKIVAADSGLFSANETIGWLQEAVDGAEAAVNLQDHDYITHWVKGFVLCNTGSEPDFCLGLKSWETAKERFRHQTDPSDRRSGFRIEYAEQLVYAGEYDKAEIEVEAALKIPDWHRWIAAFVYFYRKKFPEALEQLDSIEEPDKLFEVHTLRAAIHEKIIEAGPSEENRKYSEAQSIESMKKFAEVGKAFYESELKKENAVEENQIEKVFLKELSDSGFLNDGRTEDSMLWRKSLASAYVRSRENLGELINIKYLDDDVALATVIVLITPEDKYPDGHSTSSTTPSES